MRKVGDLSKLHDQYFDRGFRVVGISREERDELEAMIKKRGVTFWVGVDSKNKTQPRFADGSSTGIPRYVLIDARGVVVGHHIPDEAELQQLLAEAFDLELGRPLHDKLGAAVEAYAAGRYGAAWKAATDLRDDDNQRVAAEAEFLVEKIEAYAAFREKIATHELGELDPATAHGRLMILRYEFWGTPTAKWAQTQTRKLPYKMSSTERKVWRKFESALKCETKARRDRDRKRALEMYTDLRAEFPREAAATLASERIAKRLTALTR